MDDMSGVVRAYQPSFVYDKTAMQTLARKQMSGAVRLCRPTKVVAMTLVTAWATCAVASVSAQTTNQRTNPSISADDDGLPVQASDLRSADTAGSNETNHTRIGTHHRVVTDELIVHLCGELGNPSWIIRDDAHTELTTILRRPTNVDEQHFRDFAVEKLIEHLRVRQGNTELMHRASELLSREFRLSPRAGMGIGFRPRDGRPTVGMTMGGFDSSRVLRIGDVLQRVAGVEVSTEAQVREVICSHLPGESCEIELVRDGALVTVGLVFGRFSDLQNARAVEDVIIRRAWEIRLSRLTGVEEPPPIVPQGVGADSMMRASLDDGQSELRLDADAQDTVSNIAGLDAGGENHADRDRTVSSQASGRTQELSGIKQSINARVQQLVTLNAALDDASLTPAQRTVIERQIANVRTFLEADLERRRNIERAMGLPITR